MAAWVEIADEGDEIKRYEWFKRRTLAGMMSSTGGWPKKVWTFVGALSEMEMNWIDAVFGDAKKKATMAGSARQLLDRAYLEPDTTVLDLLKAMGYLTPAEQGRVFYELLHTSGLRLVGMDKDTPVIYVPESTSIRGVATVRSLDEAWVRHTTGSLLLQARLREQTGTVYTQRGAWEAFTQDPRYQDTVR